jgi:HSP20 family protein
MTVFPRWRRRPRLDPEPPVAAASDRTRAPLAAVPAPVAGGFSPRVDVAESDTAYLIRLELPGLDPDDVEVRCSDTEVVVTGERRPGKEDAAKHFHLIETDRGAFERRFGLPSGASLDAGAIEAALDQGMLEIRIPKARARTVARIPITSM